MSAMFVGGMFMAAWLILAVPTLILLLRCYSRAKMSGFIWLIFALVVWPLVARGLSILMPLLAATMALAVGHGMFGVPGLNVFVLISLAETIVGGVLLVTSLYILDGQLAARTANVTVAPPPPSSSF